MISFFKGSYKVSLARAPAELEQVMRLRHQCFQTDDLTGDAIDAVSAHVIVTDAQTKKVVACFRMLDLESGAEVCRSYSARYYDLCNLEAYPHPMIEIGRFCVHPEHKHPDVFRVIWGALTAYVDDAGVRMLFGCSSFAGVAPDRYGDAFALLKARYLAPRQFAPKPLGRSTAAPHIYPYARDIDRAGDARKGGAQLPPLLRMYLSMGGWVSDHAVFDHDLDTLHVFTGVEVRQIPDARKRVLRAVVGAG